MIKINIFYLNFQLFVEKIQLFEELLQNSDGLFLLRGERGGEGGGMREERGQIRGLLQRGGEGGGEGGGGGGEVPLGLGNGEVGVQGWVGGQSFITAVLEHR